MEATKRQAPKLVIPGPDESKHKRSACDRRRHGKQRRDRRWDGAGHRVAASRGSSRSHKRQRGECDAPAQLGRGGPPSPGTSDVQPCVRVPDARGRGDQGRTAVCFVAASVSRLSQRGRTRRCPTSCVQRLGVRHTIYLSLNSYRRMFRQCNRDTCCHCCGRCEDSIFEW